MRTTLAEHAIGTIGGPLDPRDPSDWRDQRIDCLPSMPGLFEIHGLRIASPFPTGVPVSGSTAGTRADIEITLGEAQIVPPTPPPGTLLLENRDLGWRMHSATNNECGYLLRVHGLCDFIIDRTRAHIECRPDPRATQEHLELLLHGVVCAFLLGMRGACVLHAAAVEPPTGKRSTLVFAGASGMGKSTMAALACRAGAALVSDDLVRIEGGDPPLRIGSAPELRLRPATAELASVHANAWRTRDTVDGRTAATPQLTRLRRAPIGAIVVPSPSRDERGLALRRLEQAEAALLIARFPRIAGWCDRDVLAAQFRGIVALQGGFRYSWRRCPGDLRLRITSQARFSSKPDSGEQRAPSSLHVRRRRGSGQRPPGRSERSLLPDVPRRGRLGLAARKVRSLRHVFWKSSSSSTPPERAGPAWERGHALMRVRGSTDVATM